MKKISLLIPFAIFAVSCESNSPDDLTIPTPDRITYNQNVKPIIDQSCATAGCHNAASNSAGLTLETYAQVRNGFETRGALNRMRSTSAPMPPQGNLPGTTIILIESWINQGYLED